MRIQDCLNMLAESIHINGEVAEVGVASGALTFPMAEYVKWYNKYKNEGKHKRLFACDTFSGLPYDDCASFENSHKKGEFNYGANFKIIKSQRTDLPIVTVEGLVEETLNKSFDENQKFCFVFLDMDLYKPTSIAVKYFTKHLSVGGILGFHDYCNPKTPGINKIIEEELNRKIFTEIFVSDDCIFFEKELKAVDCFA